MVCISSCINPIRNHVICIYFSNCIQNFTVVWNWFFNRKIWIVTNNIVYRCVYFCLKKNPFPPNKYICLGAQKKQKQRPAFYCYNFFFCFYYRGTVELFSTIPHLTDFKQLCNNLCIFTYFLRIFSLLHTKFCLLICWLCVGLLQVEWNPLLLLH